ncbi:MAG: hypothetical protein Q8J75_06040, partial [Rhodocyclaceae bacterium]|nr:hypothetical protein [Rhodocyclaceae bacterium]
MAISVCEKIIPSLHQQIAVFRDHRFHLDQLGPSKADAVLQPDRRQPELCGRHITLHMDMPGFVTVAGIEEKTVRADPNHCGHGAIICATPMKNNRLQIGMPQTLRKVGVGD